MAEKESKLNLVLSAQNTASPAFEGVSAAMKTMQQTAEEISNGVKSAIESMYTTISENSKVTSSLDEDMSVFREFSSSSGESISSVSNAFRSMEESLSAVVLAVRKNTSEVTSAIQNMSSRTKESSEEMKGIFNDIGGLIGAQMIADDMKRLGDAGISLFSGAVSSAADFEANVSRIHAVLMNREPTANMRDMADTALKLGSNSKFSANEIAQGMYDLARQGLSSTQILGDGVHGAIEVVNNLAQSTDQSMSDTARVITDVLHEFNLSGDQLAKVGDVISGAMHTSSINMNDFYMSMKQVGPVASNMHQNVTDISTAIALLAQHGISGSQAGTALKNMLLGLEPHTKNAAAIMKDLEISAKNGAANSFYDLSGNLKPLPDILDVLNQKFAGLNDHQKEAALAATFTKYGLAGLNVVVTEGRDKFEELKKTLQDENASDIAHEKLNNLQGDMLRLKASTETMKKSFGDTMEPAMRQVAQTAEGVVHWFTDLSPATKKAGMEVLGAGSAAFALAGTLSSALIAIKFMQPGFALLGAGLKLLGSGFMGLLSVVRIAMTGITTAIVANPIGAIITAIVAIVAFAAFEIYKHWDSIKAFLSETWNQISKTATEVWGAISAFFVKFGNDIVSGWQAFKSSTLQVWNGMISGITGAWGAFTAWISNAAQETMDAVINAFKWLYNHNYYVKDLVDYVSNEWKLISTVTSLIWKSITDYLKSAWNTISSTAQSIWNEVSNFFASLWDGIRTVANTLWDGIKNDLDTAWNALVDTVKAVWSPIANFFSGLWDGISSAARNAWQAIRSVMSQLWKGVVTDGENIFNGLSTYFTGLWNDAYNWGENVVTMIANGIKNAAHKVAEAASSVAKTITSFLGFHSPTEEGPASDSDTWAPNFVRMFAGGLTDGVQHVQNATNALIAPLMALKSSAGVSVNASGTSNTQTVGGGLFSGISPLPNQMTLSNGIAGGGTRTATINGGIHIHISGANKDGKQFGTDIAQVLRQQVSFAFR